MPSKLSLYNGALKVLGERKLASLTENREPRYELDDVYDNEMIDRVLQQGQWNFAARTAELSASLTISPEFGYQYAFAKGDDFIRTMGIWSDALKKQPLTDYEDEAKTWFAALDVIYVSYVSNDSQFGGDFSLWPANFTEYVEHYLAYKVAPRLTGLDSDSTILEGKVKRRLKDARATDAMESPSKKAPRGSWSMSRHGYRSGDRGNRNQLIG